MSISFRHVWDTYFCNFYFSIWCWEKIYKKKKNQIKYKWVILSNCSTSLLFYDEIMGRILSLLFLLHGYLSFFRWKTKPKSISFVLKKVNNYRFIINMGYAIRIKKQGAYKL